MTRVTSATSEYKVRTRLVRWLRKQAEKAGQRLFARDDLIAIEHGWQITIRCGGFGRQYRDPRFDTLRDHVRNRDQTSSTPNRDQTRAASS